MLPMLIAALTLQETIFFIHVILLGVWGVIYNPHTLILLKSLGLDSQRAKSLALKLHAHSQMVCTMLISLCRPDVLSSVPLNFKLVCRGLLACLLATLLIFTERFSLSGTDRPFLFW